MRLFYMATVQLRQHHQWIFLIWLSRVSPAVVSVNVVKKMSQEELLQQQVPEILRRFFGQSSDYSSTANPTGKNRLRQCLFY